MDGSTDWAAHFDKPVPGAGPRGGFSSWAGGKRGGGTGRRVSKCDRGLNGNVGIGWGHDGKVSSQVGRLGDLRSSAQVCRFSARSHVCVGIIPAEVGSVPVGVLLGESIGEHIAVHVRKRVGINVGR